MYVWAYVYVYVNDQLNMNKYKTKLHLWIQRWLYIRRWHLCGKNPINIREKKIHRYFILTHKQVDALTFTFSNQTKYNNKLREKA